MRRALAAGLFLLALTPSAHAIPEHMYPPLDLAHVPRATHLFTGTALAHTDPVQDPAAQGPDDLLVFTFAVSRVWKGTVPDTVGVVVRRSDLSNLDRLTFLEKGQTYLVDARPDRELLYVSPRSATRRWTPRVEARMRAIGAPYDRDAVTSYLVRQLLEADASPAGIANEGDVEEVWRRLEDLHREALDYRIAQLLGEAMLARVRDALERVNRHAETQEEIVHRRFEERTRQEARDRYRRYHERPPRELLEDSDPDARTYALGRLMETRDPEVLEHARQAARDPSGMVRLEAADIFANHPAPVPTRYVRAIVDLTGDPERGVASMAARALGNVEGYPPEVERAIRSLLAADADEDGTFLWQSALAALSRQAARESRAWELLHALATSRSDDSRGDGARDDGGEEAVDSAHRHALTDAACWQLVQTGNRPDEVRRVVDRWLARGERLDEIAIAGRVQSWDDTYRLRVLTRVIRSDDLDAALSAASALRWTLPLDPATRPLLRSLRDRLTAFQRGAVEQLIREVEAVEVMRGVRR